MSDDKDTKRFGEGDESLAGDALLQAVRRDVTGLLGLVKGLDGKVEALDEKVDARLHDTVPLWEGVVSRLDAIATEQERQGKRLDAIEVEQGTQGARLDVIEGRLDSIDRELRHLGRRIDRAVAELSGEVVKSRMDQHDLEDRVEKLEKTPA